MEKLIGRGMERERLHASVRSGAGAVVAGPLGIGKTHLVRTVLGQLEAIGLPVVPVSATASTATIPFGALAELLPPEAAAADSTSLLRAVAAVVTRRGGGGPVVVAVDDAHLLDQESAAAILHLAVSGRARVLATVRAGEPCPDAVVALWKDHDLDRLELAELGLEEARALACERLGSHPSAALWARLWRAARGNPLYLCELIQGGQESGAIRIAEGRAQLSRPLGPSGRLVEILTGPLDRCSDAARVMLEMVALTEPLPLAVAEGLVGSAAAAELERAGLAEVHRDGARVEVRSGHPAIAETIRTVTPESVSRERARSLVSAWEAHPLRREGDRLQTGLLRLEAGLLDEPDRLLDAAADALDGFDAELAERLLTPVLETVDPVEGRLLLGRALRMRHRVEEAEEHLLAAATAATDDAQRSRAALELAQVQLYERRRPAAAMATLEHAREVIEDTTWRQELDAMAALFTTFTGDLTAATRLGDRALDQPLPTRSVLNTLAVSTIAQVLLGRLHDAEHALGVALPLAAKAPPEASLAAELLAINDFSLDLLAGRVHDSVRKARAGFERAKVDGLEDVVGVWGATLMLTLLPSGHIGEATTAGGETLAALQLSDPMGLLGGTVAIHSCVVAHAGATAEARRLLGHPALAAAAHEARSRYHRDRAQVWSTAGEGRIHAAAKHALEGGLRALDSDLVGWGAILLHDAVRLQHPEDVSSHLSEVAEQVGGDLLPAMAAHAEALAARDGKAVLAVADVFAHQGATLLAAEAAGQASLLLHTAGRDRGARRAATRSNELARRCDAARTPALMLAPPPLTAREREVSLMATSGLSNREVAGELGVSKRTVDNHLASVYRKLGVSGRAELADILLDQEP